MADVFQQFNDEWNRKHAAPDPSVDNATQAADAAVAQRNASDPPDVVAQRQAVDERDRQARGAMLTGPVASALSGLTFGFGDEALAAGRAMWGTTSYDDALAQERAQLDKYRAEHPGRSIGYEIAGAAAPALFTRGATSEAILPRIAEAAGYGAAQGGMQGFGEGRGGVGPRLVNAAIGAGIGGVTGPAALLLNPAMSTIVKAPSWLRSIIPSWGAGPRAEQKVMQGVERAGGVDAVADNVNAYRTAETDATRAGLPATNLTTGEVGGQQTARQLEGVMQTPGREQGALADRLATRQEGRLGRVNEALTASFGDLDSAYQTRVANEARRQADAGPIYRRAFQSAGELTPEDLALLRRVPRAAVGDAQTMAQLDGRRLSFNPQFDEEGRMVFPEGSSLPTPEDMHHIKVGLDRFIGVHDGGRDPLGRAAIGLRNDIRGRLDAMTPDPANPGGPGYYEQARNLWAGPSAENRALDQGRNAINMNPEERRALLADMTPAERQAFVVGHLGRVRDTLAKVDTTGNANPVRAVFKNEEQQQAILDSLRSLNLPPGEAEARFQRLAAWFDREGQGAAGEGNMMRQSATAQRQQTVLDLAKPVITTGGGAGAGALTGYLSGGDPGQGAIIGAGLGLGGGIVRRINTASTEPTMDAVTRLLGGATAEQQAAALAALRARQAWQARQVELARQGTSGVSRGVASGAATAAGPRVAPYLDPAYQPE